MSSLRFARILFPIALLSLFGLFRAATAEEAAPFYENSFALLVGINEYQQFPADKQLTYAVNDIRELRQVLTTQYGFPEKNIMQLTDKDATLANIRKSLAMLADSRRIGEQDRIFVFFSCHGQTVHLRQSGEVGFLIPTDARVDLSNVRNVAPYLDSCLSMDMLWQYLEASPAKHILVMVDACYSGYLAQAKGERGAIPSSMHSMAARRALQVITAGRKGEMTSEKAEWGHGAFTYKLLEELRARAQEPDRPFTAHDLYAALQWSVTNLTHGRQTPQMANRGTEGEFLFIPAGKGAGTAIRTTTAPTPLTAGVTKAITTRQLRICSVPSDARILLDGTDTGKLTPATLLLDDSTPDAVTLTLQHEGFALMEKRVTLTPAALTVVDEVLQPLQRGSAAEAGLITLIAAGTSTEPGPAAARAPLAVEAARRHAVEEAVKYYLTPSVCDRNSALLAARIYASASQYVPRYEVLAQESTPAGDTCTIRAHIDRLRLEENLRELYGHMLLSAGPRVVIALDTPPGDACAMLLATLGMKLSQAGFTLVGTHQLNSAEQSALGRTDYDLSSPVLKELRGKADILLYGQVTTESQDHSEVFGGAVYTVTVTAQAIKLRDGAIVTAIPGRMRLVGETIRSMIPQVQEGAALAWVQKNLPSLIRDTVDPFQTCTVDFSGIDLPERVLAIGNLLTESPRVRTVRWVQCTEEHAVLAIEYRGDLAHLLEELPAETRSNLRVRKLTGGTLYVSLK